MKRPDFDAQARHVVRKGYCPGHGTGELRRRIATALAAAWDARGDEVRDVVSALVSALDAAQEFLPDANEWLGCHGDKCRLPHCYSCFGDGDGDRRWPDWGAISAALERGRALKLKTPEVE